MALNLERMDRNSSRGAEPRPLDLLLDLLGDAHRRLERIQPGLPAHHGRPSGADALEESLDLGLEGIALLEALLLDADRQLPGRRDAGPLADESEDLLLQIQRQIAPVLGREDP